MGTEIDNCWIRTFTGKRFHPLDPESSSICIEDIAHGLSNLCRYTGQTLRFYSVAEHSVLVSRRVQQLVPEQLWIARWALLHDATEAYISDVSRPVKQTDALGEYRRIERRLQARIVERFGLPIAEPEVVRLVDTEILGTEAAQLLPPTEEGYQLSTGKLSDPIPEFGQLGLAPEDAERAFLKRFRELKF